MVDVNRDNTALLITDPQNDFLSPEGATWSLVGESVTENKTVENIENLFRTAKENGLPVFISPHYYYPTDHGWKFEGTLEKVMHDINMFDRKGPLDLDGFSGSGADWLESYKPYIEDGMTVVASPHKVYGPENNDLILQLRKRGIGRVLLGGMSANLCVEAHLRELLEQALVRLPCGTRTRGRPRAYGWGGLFRFWCRLVGELQALHRGRNDRSGQPA